MMCDLTKYLIAIPVPTKEAKVIAKTIFKELILIYGPVETILTDCGTEYVNQVVDELLHLYNIVHEKSTPYHHETVGTVDRNHRVFNEYLRSYMENILNWEDYVKFFSYCYNTTPHTSFDSKYSPFELVFGKMPNKMPFLKENKIDPIYDFDNFALKSKFKIQNAQKIANELLNKSKVATKIQYNKKSNPIDVKICLESGLQN